MHARKRRKEEGFTLVELIVVVAILGFLLSIAIPRYLTARTTAAQSATKANLHQLASAMELYMAEHPEKTAYPANNDAKSWLQAYIPKAPVPPGGGKYQYAQLDGGGSYAIWDPNRMVVRSLPLVLEGRLERVQMQWKQSTRLQV
jgi:prepilin-type N-terminal cleavage/methylation domain-containing protein